VIRNNDNTKLSKNELKSEKYFTIKDKYIEKWDNKKENKAEYFDPKEWNIDRFFIGSKLGRGKFGHV